MAEVGRQDQEYKGLLQQLNLFIGRRRKVRILLKVSERQ